MCESLYNSLSALQQLHTQQQQLQQQSASAQGGGSVFSSASSATAVNLILAAIAGVIRYNCRLLIVPSPCYGSRIGFFVCFVTYRTYGTDCRCVVRIYVQLASASLLTLCVCLHTTQPYPVDAMRHRTMPSQPSTNCPQPCGNGCPGTYPRSCRITSRPCIPVVTLSTTSPSVSWARSRRPMRWGWEQQVGMINALL